MPCDVKAPFICKHNPDLLGFHRLIDLIIDPVLDIEITAMSLTTCLSLCRATLEVSQVAFVYENRCICARG